MKISLTFFRKISFKLTTMIMQRCLIIISSLVYISQNLNIQLKVCQTLKTKRKRLLLISIFFRKNLMKFILKIILQNLALSGTLISVKHYNVLVVLMNGRKIDRFS